MNWYVWGFLSEEPAPPYSRKQGLVNAFTSKCVPSIYQISHSFSLANSSHFYNHIVKQVNSRYFRCKMVVNWWKNTPVLEFSMFLETDVMYKYWGTFKTCLRSLHLSVWKLLHITRWRVVLSASTKAAIPSLSGLVTVLASRQGEASLHIPPQSATRLAHMVWSRYDAHEFGHMLSSHQTGFRAWWKWHIWH